MKTQLAKMLREMAERPDLDKLLHDAALTPVKALKMLRGKEARRQLRAHRQLAKIHSELVAQRYSPLAVCMLAKLLEEEKPELRLKGALSVLKAGGLDKKVPPKKAKAAEPPLEEPPDLQEVMAVVAQVLEQRARDRDMAEAMERAGVCLEADDSGK